MDARNWPVQLGGTKRYTDNQSYQLNFNEINE